MKYLGWLYTCIRWGSTAKVAFTKRYSTCCQSVANDLDVDVTLRRIASSRRN